LTNQSAAFRKSNFSATGNISGEGRAYTNIGSALKSLSRYDEAIEYHKKKLEMLAQQTGEN
jgi:hypothetical protein